MAQYFAGRARTLVLAVSVLVAAGYVLSHGVAVARGSSALPSHSNPSNPASALQQQAQPSFILPTSGFVGWPYTGEAPNFHNGIDIWTGDPRALQTRKDDRNPSGC